MSEPIEIKFGTKPRSLLPTTDKKEADVKILTQSRLKYGVLTSGLVLKLLNNTDATHLRIFATNSLGKITPGYLTIPGVIIPELVEKLQQLAREAQ